MRSVFRVVRTGVITILIAGIVGVAVAISCNAIDARCERLREAANVPTQFWLMWAEENSHRINDDGSIRIQ